MLPTTPYRTVAGLITTAWTRTPTDAFQVFGSSSARRVRCPGIRRYSIGAVPRLVAPVAPVRFRVAAKSDSRLAQLVERKTLNLVVVGSSPTVGAVVIFFCRPPLPAHNFVVNGNQAV